MLHRKDDIALVVVSKQEVKEQHENAERFVKRIEAFLDELIK